MLIADFAEKYDVTKENIWCCKSLGVLPAHIFTKVSKSSKHIDENYFVKRIEYRKKVQMFNHDIYYLLREYYSECQIIEAVATYYNGASGGITGYVTNSMWACHTRSVITNSVSAREIVFYKFGKRLIRRLNKMTGHKIDVAEILDRRMNLAII